MRRQAVARVLVVSLGLAALLGGVVRHLTARRPLVIAFDARVGSTPFACGRSFADLGATHADVKFEDLRLYVHDVRVMTASGEVSVTLDEDGVWQSDGLALLDFEGSGCSGNAATNTRVVGTVPARTPAVTGVRFVLGVPPRLDHLDLATNPSPRNLSAMYWGWEAGYKYLRVERRSGGQPGGFRYHLGAIGCAPVPGARGFACAEPNLVPVALEGFDPERSAVVVDLASLFSNANLDGEAAVGAAPGPHAEMGGRGCMGDRESAGCQPLFAALGLTASGPQRLFRAGRVTP